MSGTYFVGVDVGTGSARAALVDANGRVQQMHVKSIQTWNPLTDHYEQSSDDIWNAVSECVRVSRNIQLSFLLRDSYLHVCWDFCLLYQNDIFKLFRICRRLRKVIRNMKLPASALMPLVRWSQLIPKTIH